MSERTVSKRIQTELEERIGDNHLRNLVLDLLQFEVRNWRKQPNYKKEFDKLLEKTLEVMKHNEN